jgi:hypothetical protein
MRISTMFVTFLILFAAVLYAQVIPRVGLVAYYKFEEGDGTVVVDSGGYGLNGEIMGSVDWVDGYVGGGLAFNGVDTYVNCGDQPEFNIENEITLMAWVYPYDLTDGGQHDPWISKGDEQYALKNGAGDYFEFFIYDDTWYAPAVTIDSSYNEVWHHYAGTYDGFELKLYIDGELRENRDGLLTREHDGSINTTTYELWLGCNSQHPDRIFEGVLDEVVVYEVALPEEDIADIYNSYNVSAVGEPQVNIVTDFHLEQNYPNPFNPSTMISYQLPLSSEVELTVFTLQGQKVATLVSERQPAGAYQVQWNAGDLASGIYFYALNAGKFSQIKKMTLIR